MKLFVFIILLIFFPNYILGGLLAIAIVLYLSNFADIGPLAKLVCQMFLGITIGITCILGFCYTIFDKNITLNNANETDIISIVDLICSKTTLSIICLIMFFVMVVFTINQIKHIKKLLIRRNY